MTVNIDPIRFTKPTDYYLELTREVFTKKSIKGTMGLFVPRRADDGTVFHTCLYSCATLELPYDNNKRCESSIPAGVHEMKRRREGGYAEQYAEDFGHPHVWEILVRNRSAILIHVGNYPRNTLGCILVGKPSSRPNFIGSSVPTYKEFFQRLNTLMLDKIKGHKLYIKVNPVY